jgi:O-Antigen ligase
MSAAAAAPGTALAGPRIAIESLRLGLLWLMGFAGAFVFIEPSPYEIVGALAIFLFTLTGLTLRPQLVPLALLLIFMNIGYAIAVLPVSNQAKPVVWVFISIYLAATAVFYAAMLGTNTERRLALLLRGYVAGAMIASLVAIAAYFRLFGGISENLLLYSRARGTFNDPNVLGAFIVLPALLLFYRMLAGRMVIRSGLMLLVMVAALLLTFSRAAWGQFAFAMLLMMLLTFVTSRSLKERLRIIFVAIVGALAAAAFVSALLSVDQVADLFKERATLDQAYDVGRYGRFGRYVLGIDVALDRPFGIGPLQFARYFPEDPHNSYLNAFMSGGWLTGIAYPTLILVSAFMGLRYIFVQTPWQSSYHAVYATFLGTALESAIIDSDHWRHYYLVIGVLWGLMTATQAYARRPWAAGLAQTLH